MSTRRTFLARVAGGAAAVAAFRESGLDTVKAAAGVSWAAHDSHANAKAVLQPWPTLRPKPGHCWIGTPSKLRLLPAARGHLAHGALQKR